jgi:predicted TIM-barrel fold metal-dependent hydrolase
MRNYQLVSADSHLEAPPVWAERLPKDLRDKGPRMVELEDGDGVVLGDGDPVPITGLALTAGQKYAEIRPRGRKYSEEPGAGVNPQQRVAEQDKDGVDAENLFPAVATILTQMKDPRLVRESARAYNDWLSDYCSYAPDRLFGLAIMPFTGVDDATAELRRVAGKTGIRGAWLLRFPSGEEWATAEDDKFWAAAAEVGITVTPHHNFGGRDLVAGQLAGEPGEKRLLGLMTCDMMVPTIPLTTILQLMLTGVLDRHPKLRFFFAEAGIGWIPYWLEQMDDRHDRHQTWCEVELPRRPSQYVREHCAFSFQEDHAGVTLRDQMIDNICWASDFPHSVGDWPYSGETAARQFRGVPDYERRKIQALNITEWLRVITPQEKEEMARQPVMDKAPAELLARGSRRI